MSCMLSNFIKMGVLSTPDQKAASQQPDRLVVVEPAPVTIPFVASSLAIKLLAPDSKQTDQVIQNTVYRKLTPDYFAWLRCRIVNAQKTHKAGKLADDLWESLKERFLQVHEYAVEEFGEQGIKEAMRTFIPASYQSPADAPIIFSDWLYPAKEGNHKCSHPVTPKALAKVDAIKTEALAKGWLENRLYQNRGQYKFPCGEDYGLVCHMEGNRRIGAITEQAIEIISKGKTGQQSVMRFYNPDVSQPWIRTPAKEVCA